MTAIKTKEQALQIIADAITRSSGPKPHESINRIIRELALKVSGGNILGQLQSRMDNSRIYHADFRKMVTNVRDDISYSTYRNEVLDGINALEVCYQAWIVDKSLINAMSGIYEEVDVYSILDRIIWVHGLTVILSSAKKSLESLLAVTDSVRDIAQVSIPEASRYLAQCLVSAPLELAVYDKPCVPQSSLSQRGARGGAVTEPSVSSGDYFSVVSSIYPTVGSFESSQFGLSRQSVCKTMVGKLGHHTLREASYRQLLKGSGYRNGSRSPLGSMIDVCSVLPVALENGNAPAYNVAGRLRIPKVNSLILGDRVVDMRNHTHTAVHTMVLSNEVNLRYLEFLAGQLAAMGWVAGVRRVDISTKYGPGDLCNRDITKSRAWSSQMVSLQGMAANRSLPSLSSHVMSFITSRSYDIGELADISTIVTAVTDNGVHLIDPLLSRSTADLCIPSERGVVAGESIISTLQLLAFPPAQIKHSESIKAIKVSDNGGLEVFHTDPDRTPKVLPQGLASRAGFVKTRCSTNEDDKLLLPVSQASSGGVALQVALSVADESVASANSRRTLLEDYIAINTTYTWRQLCLIHRSNQQYLQNVTKTLLTLNPLIPFLATLSIN